MPVMLFSLGITAQTINSSQAFDSISTLHKADLSQAQYLYIQNIKAGFAKDIALIKTDISKLQERMIEMETTISDTNIRNDIF